MRQGYLLINNCPITPDVYKASVSEGILSPCYNNFRLADYTKVNKFGEK